MRPTRPYIRPNEPPCQEARDAPIGFREPHVVAYIVLSLLEEPAAHLKR